MSAWEVLVGLIAGLLTLAAAGHVMAMLSIPWTAVLAVGWLVGISVTVVVGLLTIALR